MNPQVEQSPSLRLPQPSLEPAPGYGAVEVAPRQEQLETIGETNQAPQMPPMPPAPMPQPLLATPLPPQTSNSVAATDDNDDTALDEEWINKAKQIVDRTHADPYVQSAELGKFKAAYLKSRHNKEIKVAEDSKK
jgi:hypothetical protein